MSQNTKTQKSDQFNQPAVIIERLKAEQGELGLLTLNVGKTLNSLTLEMVHLLTDALTSWADDDNIKAVILRGAGDKAFCAGGDVQALYQSAINPVDGVCSGAEDFFLHEYQLDYLIHTYDKPIICLGNGIVMGGGLGLMAGASHRVVTETSRIAMPEIAIGLFPDVGLTFFLNLLSYNFGFFFGLTGAQMNANDALFCHLADFAMTWSSYHELMKLLCRTAWEPDDETNHLLVKRALEKVACPSTSLPPGNVKQNLSVLESACQHNCLSLMLEAFEQFDDDNPWLNKAKTALNKGSAFSALAIYEQLKRHAYVDLESAFISEYTLACNMVGYPDFAEGVRALLIDKDKNPQWQYQNVAQISSSTIDELFKPRWDVNPLESLLRASLNAE